MDTTSPFAPFGIDGGGTERRASGIIPDAGAGASGLRWSPQRRPTVSPDSEVGGGGTLPLWLMELGDLDGGGVLARGVESGASVGGGTNARLAIVGEYYRQTGATSSNVLETAPKGFDKQRISARFYSRIRASLAPVRMETLVSPTPPEGPLRALRDDGSVDPAHAGAASDELAVALYEQMVLARELDGRLIALQRDGRIASHASAAGEEAAIVGAAAAALRDEDWVFLASREIAAALWRGMPLAACAHHVFGTAPSAGKGRSVHAPPFWKPTRVASVSPLSGTQIPHAVGVAWAARVRKEDVAALVFFGEGATSSGDFHTGLNFAGVTRAPVLALVSQQWLGHEHAGLAANGQRRLRGQGRGLRPARGLRRRRRRDRRTQRGARGARARVCGRGRDPHRGGDGAPARRRRRPGLVRPRPDLAHASLSRGAGPRERRARRATHSAEVRADIDRAFAEAAAAPPLTRDSLFDDVYAVPPWHLREQRAQAEATPAYAQATETGARP